MTHISLCTQNASLCTLSAISWEQFKFYTVSNVSNVRDNHSQYLFAIVRFVKHTLSTYFRVIYTIRRTYCLIFPLIGKYENFKMRSLNQIQRVQIIALIREDFTQSYVARQHKSNNGFLHLISLSANRKFASTMRTRSEMYHDCEKIASL